MRVIVKPDFTMYEAVVIDENTDLSYENEEIKQTIKNLVLITKTQVCGDGYKSTIETEIELAVGDIVVFDGEQRGYIKPVQTMCTIENTMEDLKELEKTIKEV